MSTDPNDQTVPDGTYRQFDMDYIAGSNAISGSWVYRVIRAAKNLGRLNVDEMATE